MGSKRRKRMRIILLIVLLQVSLSGAGVCSYGAYECFKTIGDKFAGCLFGFNGLMCIILFVLAIITLIKLILS